MAKKPAKDNLKQRKKGEDLKAPPENAFPRVKFTGQQPGEEGVERDEEPEKPIEEGKFSA
jgi:hypothetical protein